MAAPPLVWVQWVLMGRIVFSALSPARAAAVGPELVQGPQVATAVPVAVVSLSATPVVLGSLDKAITVARVAVASMLAVVVVALARLVVRRLEPLLAMAGTA